jgi:hypothetical protein
LAADAALPSRPIDNSYRQAARRGLDWLLAAVETNNATRCSPIGFYFAKLWYYEKLYPTIFTVSALGQAMLQEAAQHADREEPAQVVAWLS